MMLRSAPKFYEVAKRIVEMTKDCIIVAHNSEFDYRILRTEFGRLGFEYKRKTLCTVELSKEIMPEQESYSLGKLTRALGIPVTDRHRASGDAIATVKLFKMLLAKDLKKHIIQDAVKAEPKYEMATNLKFLIEDLPAITGVYYFHDTYGKILYIGKSKNIRNRVNQHFTNPKSKRLQNQVAAVTYEATGSEMIAALKENAEIRQNKPSFNRSSKKTKSNYALYDSINEDGYISLSLDLAAQSRKPVITFPDKKSGRQFLFMAVENYNLCPKLTGLDVAKTSCYNYHSNVCHGACITQEPPTEYNQRVQELLDRYSLQHRDVILIDKGREINERSVVLIEEGVYRGFGYYNLNYQITNKKVFDAIITPMEDTSATQDIIQSYLRKNKQIKITEVPS